MRRRQKLPLSTIIKRVVGITLLLALLEVVFIFFYMNSKHSKKPAVTKSQEVKQAPVNLVKDTTPIAGIIRNEEAPKREPVAPDTIYKNDVIQEPAASPVIEKKKVEEPKKVDEPKKMDEPKKVDEKKKTIPVVEPVKTYVQRQLSHEEMTRLLNDIIGQKAKFNNSSNCIQIRKTASSNIDNGFEIATFLKQNGFVISGREVINTAREGILIDASESCIKLTIGSL